MTDCEGLVVNTVDGGSGSQTATLEPEIRPGQRPELSTEQVQARTIKVLASAQILGGVGVAAGAAVGALLAADLASDSLAGLAASASAVGAAVIAIPVSRIMNEHGRRPGLMFAYTMAILGAILVVTGAIIEFFPLALLGLLFCGSGNAATLQSRYAATDLAPAERRGRALATVVWATTLGSVLGPNLAAPLGRMAERISVPELAGPYLLSMVVWVLAMLMVFTFMRPDPLLTARALSLKAGTIQGPRKSVMESFDIIVAIPAARVGLAAMMIGQAVMTAVMSMTPVHLKHSGEGLRVVGLVISIHIAGMYAFSPLVGMLVDRVGRRFVIGLGGVILLASFLVSGTASGNEVAQLSVGLMLLGLGWSCTLIAGSTLLSESVLLDVRPSVQGAADLLMGMSGATAGLLAGVIVGVGSYALLTIITTFLVTPMLIATFRNAMAIRGERHAA
jgi:MFS family permease